MRLDGKVAIVTGGAQGLGGAHTDALISHGANVVVADIRDEEGVALVERINAREGGKRAHYVRESCNRVNRTCVFSRKGEVVPDQSPAARR